MWHPLLQLCKSREWLLFATSCDDIVSIECHRHAAFTLKVICSTFLAYGWRQARVLVGRQVTLARRLHTLTVDQMMGTTKKVCRRLDNIFKGTSRRVDRLVCYLLPTHYIYPYKKNIILNYFYVTGFDAQRTYNWVTLLSVGYRIKNINK